MRRNCNLGLRLVPPLSQIHQLRNEGLDQQLTIFYDGKISVCDVTELQARAIIYYASRELMESKTPTSPQLLQSPLYSPRTGLSIHKSLQGFLQKRKTRIQATSPYYRH